jgi:hypothetical protein
MHHNLHQHVSNEISTASSVSGGNQNFLNNKNLTCVPCAYSNDTRPTAPLMGPDGNGDLPDVDNHIPVSVVIKNETKNTNQVVDQSKSK